MEELNLNNPFDRMKFTDSNCFLCGEELKNSFTKEHIFPKWVLRKLDLWNKNIVLLNGTEIPYKNLTVPCCKRCNNQYLSNLERVIMDGVNKGFDEFFKIEEIYIFQWMIKIFYTLLYKELFLVFDRKHPAKGNITDQELLEKFDTLHGFLQSIITPTNFILNKPWSIFIFKTIGSGDKYKFDYKDKINLLSFAIRIDEIGIIMCLDDNGLVKEAFNEFYFSFLIDQKFNPMQFDQLCARIFYQRYLLDHSVKYIAIVEEDLIEFVVLPIQGYSTKPLFREFDAYEYADFLFQYLKRWGLNFEDIYQEPDHVMELIINEDGSFNEFSLE